MLGSLTMVPRGYVLLSLVSGYWGRHSSGTGFGLKGKAAFYLSRWLDSGAIKSNDLFKITKGFNDSTGGRKLGWEK